MFRIQKYHAFLACLAISSTPASATTADSLLTGIQFARAEVENATRSERKGIISLCQEASASASSSPFWQDLSMDCTHFIALSLTETFGRSISGSCFGDMQISRIYEVSEQLGQDGSSLGSIKRILATSATIAAEQLQLSPNCVEAIRKVYITMQAGQ